MTALSSRQAAPALNGWQADSRKRKGGRTERADKVRGPDCDTALIRLDGAAEYVQHEQVRRQVLEVGVAEAAQHQPHAQTVCLATARRVIQMSARTLQASTGAAASSTSRYPLMGGTLSTAHLLVMN